MVLEDKDLWQAALGEIELGISKANFLTWFKDTRLLRRGEGLVTIHVPNTFAKEWLEKKYHKYIVRALRNISQDIKEIEYTLNPPEPQGVSVSASSLPKLSKTFPQLPKLDDEQLEIKDFIVDKETGLNPKYTFENFIVGGSNELACAAALSVVKNPGTTYNPLFIYGGVGLGKTHLLEAVGNALTARPEKIKVKYVSSEKFTNEVISAIQNQGMEKLNDQYRRTDVLIIDDVQFLAGKERTQEVFFHTFNALYEKNKQIILSSDRAPRAIPTLEERLRSRFEGGMIADIGYPDFETRVGILKAKLKEKEVQLQPEVIDYIASVIQRNIRELEGALTRLLASCRISGNPNPTFQEAKVILDQLLTVPKKVVSVKHILKTVAEFYDVTEKDVTNRSRRKEIVKPRQICMYLIRSELSGSYPFIGEKLGGRDHTTIIHGCEKIQREVEKNEVLNEELRILKERLYL